MDLWDSIFNIANREAIHWHMRGYFNTILNASDNIGRLPVLSAEIEDFKYYIEACDLTKIMHKVSPFAW